VDNARAPRSLPRLVFPDGELGAWAVLGDLTDRSVRVWLRQPSGSADVRLAVDGTVVAEATVPTGAEHDHINAVVLDAGEPRPSAAIEVRVGQDVVRRARFAPAANSPTSFSFAFGSCHEPFTDADDDGRLEVHPGAAIYPRIRGMLEERGARFALWLGDQVYSDAIASLDVRKAIADDGADAGELLEAYRHLYRGYFNERGFRELAEVLPAYLMWDDHDIVDGWGSVEPATPADGDLYRAAEQAFTEYQTLRNPGGRLGGSKPFGFSFWHGDVGFHVADLRSERSFDRMRVMSDEGWARLDAFLAEAADRDVATVFIGLSVPVVHASPMLMRALGPLRVSVGRDVSDRWSVPHFAGERTKLVERLFAWQSARPRRQVIVLSGDVHVGAAFSVRPARGPGRFAQWTSSALSTPDGLQHVVANRVITSMVRLGEHELRVWKRGLATSNNVGLVDVEPVDGGGHRVSLTVFEYDARGNRLRPALRDESLPGRTR
jgi:phosphodiesterase/alkaline phosphatase D-like protein